MDSVVSFATPASDCVGLIIDARFPLLRWLGGTEHSSVFLTELDGDSRRKAVLKLISTHAPDAGARLAQWTAAANLSHPHLSRVFRAGHCELAGNNWLYVVTEYADEVLSDILAARALSPEEATEMLGPVLDALSWLHARNLVHGRLTPSNIWVVDESLKLSVDGLSTAGQAGPRSSSSGRYDAPELASGYISPAADIWSLGVVLVEALSQRPPVWDSAHGAQPAVPIPEPFSTLVRGCLQIDPSRRPTLGELRAFLQPASAAAAESVSSNESGSINAIRQQLIEAAEDEDKTAIRRAPALPVKPRTMILAGAGALLAVVIGVVVLTSHHTQSSPPTAEQSSAQQQSAPQTSAPEIPTPQASAPSASAPSSSASGPAARKTSAPPAGAAPSQPAQPDHQDPQPSAAQASAAQPSAPNPAASPAAEPQPQSATPLAGPVVKGAVASRTTPDVPQHILDTIQGHVRVRIRVEVDPQGNITAATADDPGPSRYFAGKALKAAQAWKFTPAQVDGHAAASTWMLHFSFGPADTTVTPEETAP